jgi:putative transposase
MPQKQDLELLRATRARQQPHQREQIPHHQVHERPEQAAPPSTDGKSPEANQPDTHREPRTSLRTLRVRQLILRLARENSQWGYVRIVGELGKLGITVSATLVRNVLAGAGIPPAPERGASSWRSFLRQHGDTILACDFFTIDTVWLRRLYVLFFVSIGTRRVEYVACTSKPDTPWITQQARNLLMDIDDRSRRPRVLIHDRDTKFSGAFDGIFRSEGMEIVRTPIQAPNANAYAERWVGSVRRECLAACSTNTKRRRDDRVSAPHAR